MKAKILLEIRPWNGWSEKQPEGKNLMVEVTNSQILTPKILGGQDSDLYSLEISVVNTKQVTVKYRGLIAGEKIDLLNSPRHGDLDVLIGQKEKFTTPTMDSGTHLIMSLEEIK